MGRMPDENFSRPGAVDLSSLSSAPPAAGGASYVLDASEADFQQLAQLSAQYPVLVEFHSPRDTGGPALSQLLREVVNAAEGRFLLARVDVDQEARLAQAVGVQAVPTVVALIGGQMAPLFQGTKSREEVQAILDQVAQLAVANGMTGRAQPVAAAPTPSASPAEPPADPRFQAADDALEAGDYARAVSEFDALLAATPGDAEAIAGRAQASLLHRSTRFDPAEVVRRASAEPDDVDAQLQAADLEVIQGSAEAAFDRLLSLARGLAPDQREPVRLRLLELFEVVGRQDPAVSRARRQLSQLLF